MATKSAARPVGSRRAPAILTAIAALAGQRAALRHADTRGLFALVAVTAIGASHLVYGGTLIGQDAATQFYPWYSLLGERLRSFDIPAWNPYQFAGAPFAADPQSGWTYLPAMVLFGLLPLAAAVNVFLLFHLLLAGLATYALGRVLGMNVIGALVAGIAFEFTGLVYGRSICCPAHVQVAAWVPVALVSAEMALCSGGWRRRIIWWGAAGLALSQILASWIGQGAYYALLTLGAFLIYRTVLDSPIPGGSLRVRIGRMLLHGSAVLAVGFGLAAAGILPRLQYNSISTVPDGTYQGEGTYAADIGGISRDMLTGDTLLRPLYYPGAATITLALLAVFLARGRLATPFFTALGLGGLILALDQTTPLHAVLYAVLPRFEELHRHWPERIAIVAFLAPPLLAGAVVSSLGHWRQHRWPVAVAALPMACLAAALLRLGGVPIWREALVAALAAALALSAVVFPSRAVWRLVPVVLLLTVTADLFAARSHVVARGPYGGFHRVDLNDYYGSTGAVTFLQAQAAGEPFRFFGYDPQLRATDLGRPTLYRDQFADGRTAALIVNNRGVVHDLQDIQGYNPVQVQRYADYMLALNWQPQDYHDANVFQGGLDSPLLNLLNVRYIVIPASPPSGRADLIALTERYPVVYADESVWVLANPSAAPRAWLVHEARQVQPGAALDLLASNAVAPERTALLEEPPPELTVPADQRTDQVDVVSYRPEEIAVNVSTEASGILILSEIYDPAWRAYVDGKPVKLYVANHALRAVPVPAGHHLVELRYESTALRYGMAISFATVAMLCLSLLVAQHQVPSRSPRRSRALGC